MRSPKTMLLHPVIYGGNSLLPMKYAHPPYRFMFADLAQVDLGGFEILVSEDDLGNDLQRYPVSAAIGCGYCLRS